MMKNDPLQASLIVSGLGKKMEYKKWSKHGKALIADNHTDQADIDHANKPVLMIQQPML